MTKAKTYNATDLEEVIRVISSTKAKPDVIPAGWFTSEQLMQKTSMTRSTFNRHLNESIDAGLIERKNFVLVTTRGMRRQVPHYRVVKK